MKMKKPEFNNDAANAFINGGREPAPVAEKVVEVEEVVATAKRKPGRKPDPNKQPVKYISLRVPPMVHESLLEYTFKNRDKNISMNTYAVEAIEEKMKRDGLL